MPGKIETAQASDMPECRGVYLLTHPRSASNMFQTMMAKQPNYQNSGYKLFHAGFASIGQMQRGPLSAWPEEDRRTAFDAFEKGWQSLQDEVADAQKNVRIQKSALKSKRRHEASCGSHEVVICATTAIVQSRGGMACSPAPVHQPLTTLTYRGNKPSSRNTLSSS
jgi:hypothetical protein